MKVSRGPFLFDIKFKLFIKHLFIAHHVPYIIKDAEDTVVNQTYKHILKIERG